MNGLVAVPVYNEEANLLQVILELQKEIPSNNLLFINDGSTDNSKNILEECGVNYLSHPINLGYDEALRTAMHYTLKSNFEFVVFFDSDGQHRTPDLVSIIKTYYETKSDLIIGSRYKLNSDNSRSLRSLGTKFFSKVASSFSKIEITDVTCGLKLISREFIPVALKLPAEDMHAEFIVGFALMGAKICEVPIEVPCRVGGTSMYHFTKAILYPIKTLLCLLGNIIFYKNIKQKLKASK